VGKPGGKNHWDDQDIGWEENIKMDLREMGWDVINWIDETRARDQWRALVNKVMNFVVP
jgi:hypothetical protein